MAISSSPVLHLNTEFKKCIAILEVAFSFIYQLPLYSAVFRISWEDYFAEDELLIKMRLTNIFGILENAVLLIIYNKPLEVLCWSLTPFAFRYFLLIIAEDELKNFKTGSVSS